MRTIDDLMAGEPEKPRHRTLEEVLGLAKPPAPASADKTATKRPVALPRKRTIGPLVKSRLPEVRQPSTARKVAEMVASVLPGSGEGMAFGQGVNAARDGNLGESALNFAMSVPVAGKGVKAAGKAVKKAIKAWHGSPHRFDAFDLSKIGTGEGGSTFGHGVNLATDRAEAEAYRNAGAGREGVRRRGNGYLYEAEVDATPDDLLDWDRPLSAQPPVVQAASHDVRDLPLPDSFSIDGGGIVHKSEDGTWRLKAGDSSFRLTTADVERLYGSSNDPRGSGIYGRLRDKYGSKGASDSLRARGVVGLRYIDPQATVPGSSSFTIFDPERVRVVARSGKKDGGR